MADKDVTIYTVAAEAGVSISTVSLTLNRPDRVKATTRRHVLEVIDRLGFVPRATALNHARRSLVRIGVLAPFSSYESYQRRLAGVMTESADASTDLIVFDQISAAESALPLLDSLPLTNRLDGLLVMGLPLGAEVVRRIQQRHLPTVLLDTQTPEFSSVTIDDDRAGSLAAQRLLTAGFTRFAWVREAQRSSVYRSAAQLRGEGFHRTLSEAGVSSDDVLTVETSNDVHGGRSALRQVLDAGVPVGVFAHHDVLAAGILHECNAQGITVPDDVAIIGVDDGVIAETLDITTIRQPLEVSGQMASRLLRDALAGTSAVVQHIRLDVELVARATA